MTLDPNKYSGIDKASVVHSSGQAQLGQGARIGSASSQTFLQRLEIAQRDRRTVGSYQRSKIGSCLKGARAKQATPESLRIRRLSADNAITTANLPAASAQARQVPGAKALPSGRPAIGFREPSSRKYNPYA